MREIKFKFWNKEVNRFENDHLLSRGVYQNPFERSDLIACQFTGLYDCKGVPIYEGDILRCERDYWDSHRNLVVEWHTDCWSLLKVEDPVDSEVMRHDSSFDVPEYQREIIGNIYENPELLKITDK